jgi:hypothetical protein
MLAPGEIEKAFIGVEEAVVWEVQDEAAHTHTLVTAARS